MTTPPPAAGSTSSAKSPPSAWKPKDTTVAIQGFGNAGQHIASFLAADGYRVVAVSDSRGGIHNPGGLDVQKTIDQKNSTGRLPASGSSISNEDLLELGVDILVPAALENVLTADNAGRIRAKLVLELANGPTTPEADDILFQNGCTVVPDILANAGGVTVSYFEWVQNRQGDQWPVQTVHERLQSIMAENYRAIDDLARQHKIPLRTAAYAHALNRLADAHEATGTREMFRRS